MPNDTAAAQEAPAAPRTMPTVFTPRDAFELVAREAKVYAQSSLVPKDYQDNPANCLIALNMAKRIGADPLMTMQNLYVVHGRPGWSGQFLIASFNQCGRFSAMRFEWKNEKEGSDAYGCRAYATEKATGEKIAGPWVTWKMVRAEGWDAKNGSKWKTIPELMFHYRAAAFMVRTHAPEIAMGLQTVEELHDVAGPVDVTAQGSAEVTGIDRVKQQMRDAAAATVDTSTGEVIETAATIASDETPADRPTMPTAAVKAQLQEALEAKSRDRLDQAAANIALVVSVKDQKELADFYKQALADLDE